MAKKITTGGKSNQTICCHSGIMEGRHCAPDQRMRRSLKGFSWGEKGRELVTVNICLALFSFGARYSLVSTLKNRPRGSAFLL
jgi:hypothetical protein